MKDPIIKTRQTDIAAYLLAVGAKLVRVEHGAAVAVFVFSDPGGATSRALEEWHLGEALIPAKAYSASLRELRLMLWEHRKQASA